MSIPFFGHSSGALPIEVLALHPRGGSDQGLLGIPVIMLTGYLGAGKTTVLNRLLAAPWVQDLEPALVINEFGKLGVDGKLVDGGQVRKFEINQGSLFCTCTRHQFVQAMSDIASAVKPGMVLIESTGIAETRTLAGSLAIPALSAAFRMRANLCVVDAVSFVKVAAFLTIAVTQVRWADGLIVTKGDQVPAEDVARLRDVLGGLNAEAPVCEAPFGEGAAEFALGVRHIERQGEALDKPPAGIVAVSIESDARMDRVKFMAAIESLGSSSASS